MTIVQCTDFKIGHVYRLAHFYDTEAECPNTGWGFRITQNTNYVDICHAHLSSSMFEEMWDDPEEWQLFMVVTQPLHERLPWIERDSDGNVTGHKVPMIKVTCDILKNGTTEQYFRVEAAPKFVSEMGRAMYYEQIT